MHSREKERWLQQLAPAGVDSPLVIFFPFAGGSASYFLPAARILHGHAEVLGVQYPGRQSRHREQPIDDLHALADAVFAALPDLTRRTVILFGHSMGAIVAYEVARRLQTGPGMVPHRLFASGRRAPSCQRDESIHLGTDEELIAEVRRLGGTDDRVLSDPEILRMALPAIRADYRAIETYRHRHGPELRCRVSVLVGDKDPLTTLPEAHDWSRHSTEPVEMTVFEGGHFFLADHGPQVVGAILAVLPAR